VLAFGSADNNGFAMKLISDHNLSTVIRMVLKCLRSPWEMLSEIQSRTSVVLSIIIVIATKEALDCRHRSCAKIEGDSIHEVSWLERFMLVNTMEAKIFGLDMNERQK
jgi:hypothetical protein